MREYLKELLIVLASSWDPWIPIAMWDWGFRGHSPLGGIQELHHRCQFFMPSSLYLGKNIYLLFIGYVGESET